MYLFYDDGYKPLNNIKHANVQIRAAYPRNPCKLSVTSDLIYKWYKTFT